LIRKATKEDISQIHRVINITNRVFYQSIIPKKYFRTPILTFNDITTLFEKMTFYVYERKSSIIGTSALKRENDVGEILWVYVLPDQQRKGIGSALICYLENFAIKTGIKQLKLFAFQKAFWAIKFYEKHGYIQIKLVQRPWGNDVMMLKELH
jgi:N-acetylglutamate synthase-like GNAT family acetyltransferase